MEINDFKAITKQDIDNYLYFLKYELNNNPKTRNRKLASLKRFFEYLSKNNYITADPTKFTKTAQTGKRLPQYLNLDESKKLLSTT